ncbi:hypothetical protein V493_03708 [Pseudogymnoascus sp. VKM F-4281 (FW-2241)]|nr:hypothetical protein V493_03708 [Pseudogymnoascus sp. VKM F-4281 (FW-2241)]
MPRPSCEARIVLAINAIQSSDKLSVREVCRLYDVPRTSLQRRMNGYTARAETYANGHILTTTEEEAIVQYVLDLDMRGFPPRIASVKDMANLLLALRSTRRVGKQWAYRFVSRRQELKTRFTRVYDFQRALCEDPELMSKWFQLVLNM